MDNKEKSKEELLKEKLFYKKKNAFKQNDDSEAVMAYAEGYKKFLDNAKTEREAVKEGIKLARGICGTEGASHTGGIRGGKSLHAERPLYQSHRHSCHI